MYKIFFTVYISLLMVYFSDAQLPPGSTAPNFVITDIEGEQHNLYDILDSGKSVLLDLFAVWCGPCWDFAETGVFEDFNDTYGNSTFTIAIEADPNTPFESLYGGTPSIGDWTELIGYSLANDDQIADAYALEYYPTIYLICPDRTINEIGQLSPTGSLWNLQTLAQEVFTYTCEPIEGINGSIQSYNSELDFCGEEKIEPVVSISNTGTDVITSCTIETILEGEVISTTNWNGYLPYLATEQVVLEEISGSLLTVSFNIQVDEDIFANDDTISVEFNPAIQSHGFLNIQVNTDSYPEQTSWEIKNSLGQIVASQSYDAVNANQNVEINHSVSLDNDCYTFKVMDSEGDGFSQSGSISVIDANGIELIYVSGEWGGMQMANFEVSLGMDIFDIENPIVSLFPNPASDYTLLKINNSKRTEGYLQVINLIGQKMFKKSYYFNDGLNDVYIPVQEWNEGIYYIEINTGNYSYVRKLSVLH